MKEKRHAKKERLHKEKRGRAYENLERDMMSLFFRGYRLQRPTSQHRKKKKGKKKKKLNQWG